MQRLLWFLAACLVSTAIVLGQGTVIEQSAVTSGTQRKTLHTNSNGTVSPTTQGRAIRTPSTPIQELPGNSNPANAATGDAGANGQAMRPNPSQSGTPGTAAGNAPNGNDNNGIKSNGVGKSPVNGSSQIPNANRGALRVVQWFWIALGFVVGLIVIGVLASRRRVREESYSHIATPRRDDQIRRAG